MPRKNQRPKRPKARQPNPEQDIAPVTIDWEEHARELVRLGILPPTALSNSNYDSGMNRPNQPDRSRYRLQQAGRSR
jgi:hypothetical protein